MRIALESGERLPPFYTPSAETLSVLNHRQWICSYSGGKDSTSLVTWIEWLRRSGQMTYAEPRLAMSDTGVEFPFLQEIAGRMMERLTACGWRCEVVLPAVRERLYCRIFGRGNTPIYPGIKRMRWCTQSTKIDPMERFAATLGPDVVQLSGVRYGESKMRDGKLNKRLKGCAAGGECGLPDPTQAKKSRQIYSPIINWKTCQVVDWLSGLVARSVRDSIADLLEIATDLLDVYEVRKGAVGFGVFPPEVRALRFGCIGCPAIGRDKLTDRQLTEHPSWKHLKRIYWIWEQCWTSKNRCPPKGKMKLPGPLRMEARQRLFVELLKIQEDSGVVLVTEEDIAFIKQCWKNKVYPRGWSEEDE